MERAGDGVECVQGAVGVVGESVHQLVHVVESDPGLGQAGGDGPAWECRAVFLAVHPLLGHRRHDPPVDDEGGGGVESLCHPVLPFVQRGPPRPGEGDRALHSADAENVHGFHVPGPRGESSGARPRIRQEAYRGPLRFRRDAWARHPPSRGYAGPVALMLPGGNGQESTSCKTILWDFTETPVRHLLSGAGLQVFSTCPPSYTASPREYLRQVNEVAAWSEAAGCEGILIYTDNGLVDPWTVANVIVSGTQRLAPLVAVQPIYMHPYSVAKIVSSLALFYGRRTYL